MQIFQPVHSSVGLMWAIVLTVAMSIGLFELIEKPVRTLLNGHLERSGWALLARSRHHQLVQQQDA